MLILFNQPLLNMNVIREKFHFQLQQMVMFIRPRPNSWQHRWQTFFGLWAADMQTASVSIRWSADSSNLSRSLFVNIVKSSLNLKLVCNPTYCLSAWSFSNCKMTLISSLSLHDRFNPKVIFHQFPFLLEYKRHLHWICLKLHQKKLPTHILKKGTEFNQIILHHIFVTQDIIAEQFSVKQGGYGNKNCKFYIPTVKLNLMKRNFIYQVLKI